MPMSSCIESQEEAFRVHAAGRTDVPHRVSMRVRAHDGLLVAMPARIDASGDGGAEGMRAYKRALALGLGQRIDL